MTGQADHRLAGEIETMRFQAEAGILRVVKGLITHISRQPGSGLVTLAACLVEHPGMHIRFNMAGGTIGDDFTKLAIQVTIDTFNLQMRAIEWKRGAGMIKVGNGTAPIVAGETIGTEVFLVLKDELGLLGAMAGLTAGRDEFKPIGLGMTSAAIHRTGVIVDLVPE